MSSGLLMRPDRHRTLILDGNKDVNVVRDQCEKLTVKSEITTVERDAEGRVLHLVAPAGRQPEDMVRSRDGRRGRGNGVSRETCSAVVVAVGGRGHGTRETDELGVSGARRRNSRRKLGL